MRWTLGATLSLLLLVPAGIASAGPTEDPVRDPDPVPQIEHRLVKKQGERKLLDRPRHGRDAIKQLGDDLDDAARTNGMSVTKLKKILTTDSTAWLARNGRMYYVEQAEGGHTHQSAALFTPPFPLTETFLLHSKAGSNHTIYLDFDGFTLSGDSLWADPVNGAGMTPGTFTGFSMDGNPATFTDAEKTYIQQVWQITAEKYAAYDVDVTTEDLGAGAYNRSSAGDATYGDRVVFSDDPDSRVPGCTAAGGCGGVAWVDTFAAIGETGEFLDYLEPAWVYTTVFSSQIPAADAANAAAHEVGHTLGLEHDGIAGGDEYYGGHSNWFPIMGSGFYAVGQFSKGEYTNASQTQDDLAVIQTVGGLPLRGDDYGDLGTPTALGAQASYTVDGIIEDRTDQDAFTIDRTACTGDFSATATGIGEGQALDLQVSILSAGGSTLATNDPVSGQDTSVFPHTPTGLDASALAPGTAAGTYRVVVDGVGKGTASTGYNDYGSIGQYHLTITGCAGSGGEPPSAPQGLATTRTPYTGNATLTWNAPSSNGDGPLTGYRIGGLPTGTVDVPVTPRSKALTGLTPGVSYNLTVAALNEHGAGPTASTSLRIDTWVPTSAPGLSVTPAGTTARVRWSDPANPGLADLTQWNISVYYGSTLLDAFTAPYGYTGVDLTGMPNATFTVKVQLLADADLGTATPVASRSFTMGPSAPRIGRATSGTAGRPVTAKARWQPPAVLRGSTITGYRVLAYKLNSRNQVVRRIVSTKRSAAARSYVMRLPAGRYKFKVVAYSAGGTSPLSSYSRIVTAR